MGTYWSGADLVVSVGASVCSCVPLGTGEVLTSTSYPVNLDAVEDLLNVC